MTGIAWVNRALLIGIGLMLAVWLVRAVMEAYRSTSVVDRYPLPPGPPISELESAGSGSVLSQTTRALTRLGGATWTVVVDGLSTPRRDVPLGVAIIVALMIGFAVRWIRSDE